MGFNFPSIQNIPKDKIGQFVFWLDKICFVLILLLFSAILLSFSFSLGRKLVYSYGADIVFVLDESGSMSYDFRGEVDFVQKSGQTLRRIEASKKVVTKFVERRKQEPLNQDRYSLVVFGSSAATILPLVSNYEFFLECLDAQKTPLGSTNIDVAIFSAVKVLLDSGTRTKIILVVSDAGGIIDLQLIDLVKLIRNNNIKIYFVAIDPEEDFLFKDTYENTPAPFLVKLGSLGKIIRSRNLEELNAGFDEIYNLERSLIAYYSRGKEGDNLVFFYVIFGLMFFRCLVRALTIESSVEEGENRNG